MARKRRAAGGRTTLYNAKGSPAAESAMKETGDGFKRGGKTKARKSGGSVEGSASEERMDKRARGGALPGRKHGGSIRGMKSAGGSPMSSGHNTTDAPAKGNEAEAVG
jgi:hypothetical protein